MLKQHIIMTTLKGSLRLLMPLSIMAPLSMMAQQRSAQELSQIVAQCSHRLNTQGMQCTFMSSDLVQQAGISTLADKDRNGAARKISPNHEAFAVFTAEEHPGFVIVSADQRMPEVLAVSNTATFDTKDGKNEGLMQLLNSYAEAYCLISEGKASAEQVFGSSRHIASAQGNTVKSPLLNKISFDQDFPYNLKTPIIGGKHSLTGCSPTAAAMLMKYYEYPRVGKGINGYYTKTNNIYLEMDFESTPFDWANILDSYPGFVADNTTNVTYDDAKVFAFSGGGGFEYDDSYPTQIKLTKCYQYSSNNISGKLQLVAENADKSIRRVASDAREFNDLAPRYGWSYFYLHPALPADLPDGEYSLFLGYTDDDINYTYARRSSLNGADNYSVKITKTGSTFIWQDHEFPCAATPQQTDAVATLMQAAGIAMESDYKENTTSTLFDMMCKGLITYFGYDDDMYSMDSRNATLTDIYKEAVQALDANQVIIVGGTSAANYGHSYMIDGYDLTNEEPMVHINWGWGGYGNGYFLLTQMQYGDDEKNNYSSDHYQLLINAIPDNGKDDGMLLCSTSISSSESTITPDSHINVTVEKLINNSCNKKAIGTVYLYLVDGNGTAYRCGTFYTTLSLEPNHFYKSLTRSVQIPSTIPNGTYHLEIRATDHDHFYSLENQEVEMTGSFDGINTVELTPKSKAGTSYEINGRPAAHSHRGIVIKEGSKTFRKD